MKYPYDKKDREFVKRSKIEDTLLEDSDGPTDLLLSLDTCADVMNNGESMILLPSGMKLIPTQLGYVRVGAPSSHEEEAAHSFLPHELHMFHQTESNRDPSTIISKRRRIPSGTMCTDLSSRSMK